MQVYQISLDNNSGQEKITKPFENMDKVKRSRIKNAYFNSETKTGVIVIEDGAVNHKYYPMSIKI